MSNFNILDDDAAFRNPVAFPLSQFFHPFFLGHASVASLVYYAVIFEDMGVLGGAFECK